MELSNPHSSLASQSEKNILNILFIQTHANMKIQFIWCGNMGKVILQSFINSGYKQSDITVSKRDMEKMKKLKKEYKINFWINPNADIIILAVKPQQLETVDFSPFAKKALLFSILAGTPIQKLKKVSKLTNIIRSMPNIPISVSRWIIWYKESGTIDAKKMKVIKNAFTKSAIMIKVKNEDQIDQISTLSGSWPAYFYYLTEIMQRQAEKFGFTQAEAELIAKETFIGAAKVLDQSWQSAAQLRQNVTSKKWTTQAALETMKKKGIEKIVQEGMKAAYKRAKELSL